jgi:uncharacterized RDD family membrane protein YckC
MGPGELNADPGPAPQSHICARCGKPAPLDTLLQIEGQLICADCKPLCLQLVREGGSMTVASGVRYAGFWIRGVAIFIDALIFLTVETLLWLVLGKNWWDALDLGLHHPTNIFFDWSLQDWLIFALRITLGLIYATILVARYGGTLGKLALGLRVVTIEGDSLSYKAAFHRELATYLSFLPFILPVPDTVMFLLLPCLGGLVIAAFDSQKRALHDHICQTRVVRSQ